MSSAEARRSKVRLAVEKRGLTSFMNHTKWSELQRAVYAELPFPPPFQRKDVLAAAPEPEVFGNDNYYYGDWREGLLPFYSIEWVRIAPRVLSARARLVPPDTRDCTDALESILVRHNIPHLEQDRSLWVFGYK